MTKLENELTRWGATQRHVPERNDALRAEVIANARPRQDTAAKLQAPTRFPFLSLALAGAAVFALFIAPSVRHGAERDAVSPSVVPTSARSETALGIDLVGSTFDESDVAPAALQYTSSTTWPAKEAPITDDRELLRTDYHVTMRTRRVPEHGQRLQTIIRGHGGRIDRLSLGEQYGSISFALPEDELEAFRNELRTMTRAPFLIESFDAENLLPQQQQLERIEQNVTTQLAGLRQQLDDLTTASERTIASLTTQLRGVRADLTNVRDGEPTTTSGIIAKQERITMLEQKERNLEGRIASARSDFARRSGEITRSIAAMEAALDGNRTEQQNVLDTVATVRGTITLRHITLTGMAWTYLTMYWIATLLAVLAITAFVRRRAT